MNRLIAQLHLALVFMTRLPLPHLEELPEGGLGRAMRIFPLVGLVVGAIAGAVFLLAHWLLPPLPAAVLAVTAAILVTGCLHEDGLADVADGFGGGQEIHRKLEIMRDSRIGSYGVVAVGLSLLLRVSALAAVPSAWQGAFTLIAAHALSRAVIPAVMLILPPVRLEGLGKTAGQPEREDAGIALLGALLLALVLLPFWTSLLMTLGACIAAVGMSYIAFKQIGGQTGDVLGATEQLAQTAALLAAAGCLA
jgi:adenosylcobinamide-GDP ribazoletransferase